MSETSDKVVREMLAKYPDVEVRRVVAGTQTDFFGNMWKPGETLASVRAIYDKPVQEPKPLSYEQAVYRVMKHGAWWTVRELRACILEDFGLDIEAITSRIRELRQRGHTIECERVPGSSAHRYRLASKEPA